MSARVLRVTQLDAVELDDELLSVLQKQLVAVFKVLPYTRLLQFKPELRAALKTFLWWHSVYNKGQTFGQYMLDVQYSTNSTLPTTLSFHHKFIILLLSVCVEWFRDRFHVIISLLSLGLTPRQLELILNYITAVTNTLSLFNFTVFLLQGGYATLYERLVGVVVAPSQPQSLRAMSYDYMNREILWHGFSEFIFFVLPHLNLFTVKNWLRRVSNSHPSSPVDLSVCVFCDKPPTMARVAECGHVYCYYCLHANCMADQHFLCSACGLSVLPTRIEQ